MRNVKPTACILRDMSQSSECFRPYRVSPPEETINFPKRRKGGGGVYKACSGRGPQREAETLDCMPAKLGSSPSGPTRAANANRWADAPAQQKEKMSKCYSCGKKCDPDGDRCRGCNHVVCVVCVNKYEHFGVNGRHGRRPTKRPVDLPYSPVQSVCPHCNGVGWCLPNCITQ